MNDKIKKYVDEAYKFIEEIQAEAAKNKKVSQEQMSVLNTNLAILTALNSVYNENRKVDNSIELSKMQFELNKKALEASQNAKK